MNPLARPVRLLGLSAGLAVGFACSSGDLTTDGDARDTAESNDTDAETDAADTGLVADTTWGLSGALVLTGGAVDLEASALVLETRGAPCRADATVVAATPSPAADGDPVVLLAGWDLELAVPADLGCALLAPTAFRMGLGPTDPQLRPAADRLGHNALTALGLYVHTSDGLTLVGIGGTPTQLDGTEPAPATGPLPDATYTLVPLHGLPVAD